MDMTGMGGNSAMNNVNNTDYTNYLADISNMAAKSSAEQTNNASVAGYSSKLNGSTQDNAVLGAASKANGLMQDNAVLGASAETPEECICSDVESYVKSSAQKETCSLLANSCINPECYGSKSMQYADCLLEFIYDEFTDCQSYSALACRAPNSCARRIFRCLAESEMRHSNRFVTAYFLITGRRYCPARNDFDLSVSTQSYCQTLRQLYFEESCDAAKYQTFASKVTDPCLKELALELADDEKHHAEQIMMLIQKLCTCGRRSS